VTKWLDSVDETNVFLNAISVYEVEKGIVSLEERGKTKDIAKAAEIRRSIAPIFAYFADRTLPLESRAAIEWAAVMGKSRNHELDGAICAIARMRGYTVVTQNVKDYLKRGVTVIDPFPDPWKSYG
jgi:hypothetical protein